MTPYLASTVYAMHWRHSVQRSRWEVEAERVSRRSTSICILFRQEHLFLRYNIIACRAGWTNSNCESINHVLKQYTKWRLQQLSDLVEMLRELVIGQYTEADCALCGRGQYILHSSYTKHRVTVATWKEMSKIQRQKTSDLCFRHVLSCSTLLSSDETLTDVPTTPGAGTKKIN